MPDRYVILIRKKRKLPIFGYLRDFGDGQFTGGGVGKATVYDSYEEAERVAATFILQNPLYLERAEVRKVQEYVTTPSVKADGFSGHAPLQRQR